MWCDNTPHWKDNTIYTVLLFLYVADLATILALNIVLGPYVPLRTACLLTDGKKYIFLSLYYYLINTVYIKIPTLNFLSKNT